MGQDVRGLYAGLEGGVMDPNVTACPECYGHGVRYYWDKLDSKGDPILTRQEPCWFCDGTGVWPPELPATENKP